MKNLNENQLEKVLKSLQEPTVTVSEQMLNTLDEVVEELKVLGLSEKSAKVIVNYPLINQA